MNFPITTRQNGIIEEAKYRNAVAVLVTPDGADAHRERMNAMRSIRIPLHSRKYPGLFAIVDESDRELVSQYRWNPKKSNHTIYVAGRAVDAETKTSSPIALHRLILNAPENMTVDHKNGNGLDNRRENLRLATQSDNAKNQRHKSGHPSRYKGVYWNRRQSRWHFQIKCNGSVYSYGGPLTEEQAARLYDVAATDLFGEFAHLNFDRASVDLETSSLWERIKKGPRYSSEFHGVSLNRQTGRWVSYIRFQGEHKHIGYFNTPEEAARAYDDAARELHGEFACVNFPRKGERGAL